MSSTRNRGKILKKLKVNKNNSKLYSDKSIEYNMKDSNTQFYQEMKSGYIEMAKINLELALETELLDINSETWLSGE